MRFSFVRVGRLLAPVLLGLVASGCGVLRAPGGLPPGTSIDEARRSFGGPTGQYALDGGGTRLEFTRYKQTYMLDFDAGGRLVSNQQVLTEPRFAEIAQGMPADEVLRRLGHPTWVFGVGWQRRSVWNYRFYAPLGCVIFQVSISDAGRVVEASQGIDPECDIANSSRD
ncbi:MAG: hypothetical protein ABI641_14030 [Caldimonas sp.]